VGFITVDCDIPTLLWNFVGSLTGHSKCIMEFSGEWFECNTFAVCSRNDGPQFTQHYCSSIKF